VFSPANISIPDSPAPEFFRFFLLPIPLAGLEKKKRKGSGFLQLLIPLRDLKAKIRGNYGRVFRAEAGLAIGNYFCRDAF